MTSDNSRIAHLAVRVYLSEDQTNAEAHVRRICSGPVKARQRIPGACEEEGDEARGPCGVAADRRDLGEEREAGKERCPQQPGKSHGGTGKEVVLR